MDDLNDQGTALPVDQFIPSIPNGEIIPHTRCTKRLLFKIVLVVSFVTALIVIPTVIVTTTPGTDEEPSLSEPRIERNSCLYHDFSNKFNDTLGHRCSKDSEFVKEYCVREGVQSCDLCAGHRLPKYCFCDKGDDCDGADLLRKKTCMECKMEYYCPCLNGGSCVCKADNLTGEDIRCICPEGYYGDYCGIIHNRQCVRNTTVSQLNHCKGSQDPVCFIRDSIQNSVRVCAIIIDKDKITHLETCTEQ